jgi:hypothetical protein
VRVCEKAGEPDPASARWRAIPRQPRRFSGGRPPHRRLDRKAACGAAGAPCRAPRGLLRCRAGPLAAPVGGGGVAAEHFGHWCWQPVVRGLRVCPVRRADQWWLDAGGVFGQAPLHQGRIAPGR